MKKRNQSYGGIEKKNITVKVFRPNPAMQLAYLGGFSELKYPLQSINMLL